MVVKLGLHIMVVLSLLWLGACGHVTLGSSSAAVTSPAFNDWQYRESAMPDVYHDYRYFHSGSRQPLTEAQALLYQQLSRDLSDALVAYKQVGLAGYSHVWPLLESDRTKLLGLKYDRYTQVLNWGYENLGDFDLDGIVNSIDLIPVVRYADAQFGLSRETAAFRDWLDTDHDGQLDRYNAQVIAMSYGRAVYGYNVLAGLDPDPSSMEQVGFVRFIDRLPGWPPHFELLIPSGYNYVCIQPLKYKQQVICSYIAQLTAPPDQVKVTYPVQP